MRIKKIIFCFGLLSMFFTTQGATNLKSASGLLAEPLVQALKLAGVVPKKTVNGYVYVIDSLNCHTSQAFDDGLKRYDCKINTKKRITGAQAKVLYDAMASLKMLVDAGMSQTRITAEKVSCHINLSTSEIFNCEWRELQQ